MKYLRLLPVVVLLCLGTGCASNKAKLSPEAKKLLNERYEWVTTTDSRIPQRVLKGEYAEQNQGSSPVAVLHGERARDLIRPRGLNR
ncbi:MAG: hypothetical protein SynsKO_24340 [Synoicihabitans sp.]